MSSRESISDDPSGRPLTGRAFLAVLIGSFGVVFAFNFAMA